MPFFFCPQGEGELAKVKEECDLTYHLKNINLSAIVPQEGKPEAKQNKTLVWKLLQ